MMAISRLVGWLRVIFGPISLKFYEFVGPRLFSQRYFEWRYRLRPDPWGYETSPYEQQKYQKTLEALSSRKPYERALEVGCSIGVFTERLAASGIAAEIVALDLSQAALERAEERLSRFANVRLRRADITRDDLGGSYDLIICAEVLFYLGVEQRQRVREAFINALRGGGHLVLVNPWPLSRSIHRGFSESGELCLLEERIERDCPRPYAIALFEKRNQLN